MGLYLKTVLSKFEVQWVKPGPSVPSLMAEPGVRRSRQARVRWGDNLVTVGGNAPVRAQSMTNTDTVDVIGTAKAQS